MQKQYLVHTGHVKTAYRKQGSQRTSYGNHLHSYNQPGQSGPHSHQQQNGKQNRNVTYKHSYARYQKPPKPNTVHT